jgi:hypothetical protein
MVSTVAFFGKSNDPFEKWTKKMSKIENSKILLGKKLTKLTNYIIYFKRYLKKFEG